MKTERDLDCCRTPVIMQVEATGRVGELVGKCSCCGVRWTFYECTIDEVDGKIVAAAYSRPKRNGDVLAETLHPRSAGRVLQLPKGKP